MTLFIKKHSSLIWFLAILIAFNSCKKQNHKTEQWITLFNGKDLNDWTIKINGYPLNENIHNTFSVKDGVMQVSYKDYDTFNANYGHIFYKQPFSSYKLKIQYRFIGEQISGGAGWAEKNSGVMVHSQSPESMGLNQSFPLSIEVQMLGGIEKETPRPTGNLCTPGTNVIMNKELITEHCINASSETYYGDEWVNLEVKVIKDSLITHTINGKEVLRYSKPQIGGADIDDYGAGWADKIGTPLTQGYIALQSESHPIEFRNIELLELD